MALGVATPALAAEPAAAAPVEDAGTITVTARKRSEDILKVPVTVTALTAETLAQKGVISMTGLAQSTPGININDNSSGHADRSFQQIVIRGFTPSTTLATTTSMFIDGVAVASPSAIMSISDPKQVEVVKGPQSAYYGRNTFAGAINISTKDPTSEWHGTLLGMVGTRDNYRLQGSVEGPIFGDVLTFRITGDRWAKSGSWANNAAGGGTLGDQKSTIGTATLLFKPAPNFTLKLFGLMSEDRDGAPAQARLYAYDIKSSSGAIIAPSQSNCSFQGNTRGVAGQGSAVTNAYLCGVTPKLAYPVSANVTNNDALRSWLSSPTNRIVDPSEAVDGYGLRRISHHAHANAEWVINPNITATVLAGYNREVWSTVIDLDGLDTSSITYAANPKGYWDYPYLIERKTNDWSMEGRLNYKFGRLRGVVGASYLKAQQLQGGGGGFAALSPAVLLPGGKAESRTTGMFFGATYDFTDKLSASVEGRYQIDWLGAFARPSGQTIQAGYLPAGTYTGGSMLASAKYNNFTPRAIVNYQFTPSFMAYASWAKGVNPAQFNTAILATSSAIQNAAIAAGGELSIKPEKVTNYELGVKGKLLDGRLRYTAAAYYAQWRDQINAISIIVADPTSATGTSFQNVSANTGNVDLYGVEGDFSLKVNDLITLDGAGAINASDIKQYRSTTVSQLTGMFDFSGKEMKNTSKYSANLGILLHGDLPSVSDGKWFARFDWNFKSGMWSNEANILRTPDRHIFNLRGGVSKGNVSVEAFVNNLFNNHTYTSIGDNYAIDNTLSRFGFYSAAVVGLPELRTFGLQLKVKM
ncbi:TonB-dependent receptor [Novosphingobium sediminicola]|uniref:Iron complex outermembrane receptor protein n=1 Tax=Novosphingobium sediminicola TaxID=563162 RepID=A0A7W6CGA5_9SPHN|nr:iron complex outermembrane receptor protein [Novosphingobium sediminicola]